MWNSSFYSFVEINVSKETKFEKTVLVRAKGCFISLRTKQNVGEMQWKQSVVEIMYVRSAGKTLLCSMPRALVSGFTLSPFDD